MPFWTHDTAILPPVRIYLLPFYKRFYIWKACFRALQAIIAECIPRRSYYISVLLGPAKLSMLKCITISAGRRRRLLDRDGKQEADLFNTVEGKICCFVWIDVAVEKRAECRARLSGGVNTQSYIGCGSDVVPFTNLEINFIFTPIYQPDYSSDLWSWPPLSGVDVP